MTSLAAPGRSYNRCRRFGGKLISWTGRWGTLMRHFMLPGAVTTLPVRMGVTTAQAILIASPGRTLGALAR